MKLALVMYKGEKRLAISSQDRLLSPASGEATGIPLDVVKRMSATRVPKTTPMAMTTTVSTSVQSKPSRVGKSWCW